MEHKEKPTELGVAALSQPSPEGRLLRAGMSKAIQLLIRKD